MSLAAAQLHVTRVSSDPPAYRRLVLFYAMQPQQNLGCQLYLGAFMKRTLAKPLRTALIVSAVVVLVSAALSLAVLGLVRFLPD